jgi:hypothetical protein
MTKPSDASFVVSGPFSGSLKLKCATPEIDNRRSPKGSIKGAEAPIKGLEDQKTAPDFVGGQVALVLSCCESLFGGQNGGGR